MGFFPIFIFGALLFVGAYASFGKPTMNERISKLEAQVEILIQEMKRK